MKPFPSIVLFALLLTSCGKDRELVLVTRELNTSGVKHTVHYEGGRAVSILFETFHGSGSKDTTMADSVLRKELDSIKYNADENSVLLTRHPQDDAGTAQKDFRKYYFDKDNLLSKITRFSSGVEYMTDSVAYDYTSQKASFYDLVNKHVFELVYDNRNNIESATEKRMTDQHVYQTYYYYYDASGNPFLANLDDSESLFGCFNIATIGLYWNNASRPIFSSKNNVQSFKEVEASEEHNGLFEYQYRLGLPVVQFGNEGVIYYRYSSYTEE